MSKRKLTILAIVAVVVVAGAVIQSKITNRPRKGSGAATYLIQGFDPDVVASIVLSKGSDGLTLLRQGKKFVIAEMDGYTAMGSKVNEIINICMDIKVGELYTADKDNHKDLGVIEEAATTVVKFYSADSTLLTGVVIGKNKENSRDAFVRKLDSDEVYVASSPGWIYASPTDYVQRTLLRLGRDEIASIGVAGPDGKFSIKPDGDSFDLEPLGAGKKVKISEISSIVGVLGYLSFDDAKQQQNLKEKLIFENSVACLLKDSTLYKIGIAKAGGKAYVMITAEFMDTTEVTKERGVESEEKLKAKEAKLMARFKAIEYAATHKGWVYEIPTAKADSLTKPIANLVEDISTEESED